MNYSKTPLGIDGSMPRRSITQNVVAIVCAVLTALQPLSGYANELVRAVSSDDQASAPVLPIAYGDGMLPLPHSPWDKSVSPATFVPSARIDGRKLGGAPDLTPSIISPGASYVPGESRDVVIEIKEIAGVATSTFAQVFVPRADGVFSYTFFPTQTTANALAVNNSDWTALLVGAGILFRSKAPLPASVVTRIALGTVALAPGGVANLTANISPDPTETITGNNSTTLSTSIGRTTPANGSATSLSVPASAYAGTDVTLTATVAGDSPTGTVSFSEGANTFCPYAALVGTTTKSTSCTIPAAYVTAGTHTYTALYSGSASAESSSTTASLTVLANALPTIALTQPAAAGVSINYGTGYTINVSGNDTDQGVRSIQVYDNGSPLGSPCTYAASPNTPRTCSASLSTSAALGAHNITATAIDGVGAAVTSSPPVTIAVNAVQPSGCQISGPASLAANAAGSWGVTCTGGSPITSYNWTRTPIAFTASTQSITNTPFTGTTPTSATYNVIVSNTAGSASVGITVANNSSNVLPTVSITAPADGTLFAAPATIALTATAADTDGSITKVEFFNGTTSIGSKATSPYTVNWTGVGAGSYAVTAKATDNGNAITTTATTNITVCAAPVVTLTAPANPQRIDVVTGSTATVSLSASTSALGTGCVISKMEYYNGTTLVATSTASPFSTTWSGVAASATAYSIKARAYVGPLTPGTDSAVSLLTVNNRPTVTLTAPANNAFFAAPATVAFAATAADTGGSIASVQFLNGATSLVTDATSPYSFNWTAVAAGSYSVNARVTDNAGAVADSAVAAITVCTKPTAALTAPTNNQVIQLATQTATSTVSLAATITAAATGCINKVEYLNGTTVVATATAAPWSASWINVAGGTYSIKARVYVVGSTTVFNDSAVATLYLNKPPVITLVTPSATQAAITAPGAITLSATATDTDPNVQSVSFFNGAVLIGTVNTGQAAAAPQPAQSGSTYNYVWTPGVGNYSISAFATDGRSGTATSAPRTLVTCGVPTVSLSTATALPIVPPNNSVALSATVVQPNTDAKCGTITNVKFFRTGNTTPLATATTSPYAFAVTGLTAGTTSYTATVIDSASRTNSSNTLSVTVDAAPTVSITSPANNTVVTTPASFTFLTNAADSDGTLTKVEFFNGATLIGTTTAAPWNFTWSGVPSGSYSITAKATDNLGASTTSAAITVIANNLPTVSIATPLNGASVAAGSNIALTATASDSDGTISKVEYFNGATPLGSATTSPYSVTWASVPAGSYSLTAVATDNRLKTTTSVAVGVTAITNTAPKIVITGAVVSGSQVVVSTQSSDVNGTPLTITGALNNGTVLNYSNGQLTGAAPTAAGVYTATVTASDGAATSTTSSTFAVQAGAAAENVDAGTATNLLVGSTGGSFGVTEAGAATYSIPIQVPPGTNGLQPGLALTYSSQGGYGMLGVGWSLSGLGTITRCPKNIEQDGYREAINYDNDATNDEYCYGGQRLIRTGARTYAGTGTSTLTYVDGNGQVQTSIGTESADRQEFRTEIDSYSRITGFYGGTFVANGVSRFEVETKDGRVLHFSRRFKPLRKRGFNRFAHVHALGVNLHRRKSSNQLGFHPFIAAF